MLQMIRLTSGKFRGRSIDTPAHLNTRPTQAKLRQAWMNSIQNELPEARVLELFAGTGALGFESLSRNSDFVTFVEKDKATAKIIEKNAQTLGCIKDVQIISQDVFQFIQIEPRQPYDLIFADPPYHQGYEMQLLEEIDWLKWLKHQGLFCLEWSAQLTRVQESKKLSLPEQIQLKQGVLFKYREKNYGDTTLTTYCLDSEFNST